MAAMVLPVPGGPAGAGAAGLESSGETEKERGCRAKVRKGGWALPHPWAASPTGSTGWKAPGGRSAGRHGNRGGSSPLMTTGTELWAIVATLRCTALGCVLPHRRRACGGRARRGAWCWPSLPPVRARAPASRAGRQGRQRCPSERTAFFTWNPLPLFANGPQRASCAFQKIKGSHCTHVQATLRSHRGMAVAALPDPRLGPTRLQLRGRHGACQHLL